MHDLVTWLNAQLDEDERVARTAAEESPTPWESSEYRGLCGHDEIDLIAADHLGLATSFNDIEWRGPDTIRHIARHDPARVLRDIEATRCVVDRYEDQSMNADRSAEDENLTWILGEVIRALAQPYSDRPGWREEWRP